VLRSPRARIIGSLFTVLLVAMVSLMVYAMIPFRGHGTPKSDTSTTSPAFTTSASAAGGHRNGGPAESMVPGSRNSIKATRPAATHAVQAAGSKTASRSASPPTASTPLP
jgi:hypothetical protein